MVLSGKMGIPFNHFSCALAFFLYLSLFLIMSAPAQAGSSGAGYWLPAWQELLFQGAKPLTRFLVRIKVQDAMGLCPYPMSDIDTHFIECPLDSRGVLLLSAETVTMSLLLPQEKYEHYVWFRPGTLEVLQRVRWKKNGQKWIKLYRWGREEVSRLSIRPRCEAEQDDPGRWTKRAISLYRFRKTESCRCRAGFSGPLVLVYLAAREGFHRDISPVDVCVFGKKALHRVKLRFQQAKRMKIDYIEKSERGRKRVRERTIVYVYTISSKRVGPAQAHHEPFSLLGLKKNIKIYVDVKRGTVVRVTGKNDLVGEVDLRIVALTMRNS